MLKLRSVWMHLINEHKIQTCKTSDDSRLCKMFKMKNMKKCWVKINKAKTQTPSWLQQVPQTLMTNSATFCGMAAQTWSSSTASLLLCSCVLLSRPSAWEKRCCYTWFTPFSVSPLLSCRLLWIQLYSQLTFFCPAAGCFRFSIVCDRQHLFSYMLLSCFFFPSSFLPSLPTPTSCIPLSFSLSFSIIFCNYLLHVNLRGSEATGDSSRPRLLLFYLPVFRLLFFPSPSSCFLFLPKHILPHLQLYSHVTLFIPDSCVRLLLLLFARLGLISESFLRRRWDTNRIWENLKVCWRFCKNVLHCKNSSVT